jgi:hypothetical protein
MDTAASAQMPKYRCHKEVHALKIKSVEYVNAMLTFEDAGFAPLHVPPAYMTKHDPKPGGYYVVYDDGYTSFSPAKAFEDGYTRI